MTAMTLAAPAAQGATDDTRAFHTRLDNGMEVVVIPDNRAPVVTHMVWYHVGAADEPTSQSGVAHFLEHLMFKGTDDIPRGAFSKIIARHGGQDNAFTSQDLTAYFQRVAKDRLPLVMKMEADRMVNLRLLKEDVVTERNVILEERRSRVDNSPRSILNEEMLAALYRNHPYGDPVIGWEHEIANLNREAALDFYKRFYAPNNAVLVVAGDVTPEEVVGMARETYGKIPRNDATVRGTRPTEPDHRAARQVVRRDPRAGQPTMQRLYIAPSYATAGQGEAEALDILMKALGGGATSRLYRRLVVEEKLASSAGGYYMSSALDSGRIGIYAVAASESDLAKIEKLIDEEIADVIENGLTEAELDRARNGYLADFIYESDSQSSLARRYGWALVTGQTIEDVEAWPDRLRAVTLEDISAAARKHLDIRRSVTGRLLPAARETADNETPPPSAGDGSDNKS